MIKIIFKIVPYSIIIRLYYYWFNLKKKGFNKKLKKKGYKFIDTIDLSQYKKSDKLFIIGSGYSLNNISKEQWKEINNHDTFGFNFSFINNDHIPTFYTCEAMKNTESNEFGRSKVADIFYELYKNKKEQYNKVIKFSTDLQEDRMEHFENYAKDLFDDNFYISNTVNGLAPTDEHFKKLLNYLMKKKVFNNKKNLNTIFKFRATLVMAVSFGINLGYKEIILCGIDLNDPRYFYNDKIKYPNFDYFRSSRDTPKHDTIMKSALFVKVDKVIQLMDIFLCKENKISLFIQNPNSALNSILPIYKFEKE